MSVRNERILHITLLLLLISPPQAESFIFTAIMSAVSFAYQAYNIINDAHDTYKKFAPQTTLDDVLDQAKRVEEKVDQIGAQLSRQINQAIDTIVTRIDDMNNIRDGLAKLSGGVRRIDNLYRSFELYTQKRIRLNNHTLQDYIQQVTTVSAFAPKDILNNIYDLIIPSSGLRESFLYYITKDIPENDTNSCGYSPPQGQLYQIFRLIMVNEIRAFTMMTFAFSMNQVFKCESFEGEIEYAEYDLRSRAMDYYEVFSSLSEYTLNSVRSCDPPEGWIRGKNFYEFERFMTDYIVSSNVFFNASTPCNSDCGDGERKLSVKQCDPNYGCIEETSCHGGIDNCFAIISPATLCELEPTGRRYQYFIAGHGGKRGDDTGGCRGNEIVIEEKDDCPICWCVCTEESYKSRTLRTFSTREQLSDVANNKVVTGVKFVVIENMTHIQIQQGEVLPEGRIVPKSVEWKALENIKFDEERTNKEHQLKYYIDFDNGTQYDMEILRDYVLLTWQTYRIMLDDLILPPGYVVTGVKFASEGDDKKRQPIQLGIQASPYDFDSGKLLITDDNPSVWMTPSLIPYMPDHHPEYDRERLKIFAEDTVDPLMETGTAIPRFPVNSYVIIGMTKASSDAGQTTLPLVDGQEVVGKPPFAAGGIGLYYKSISEDVGGFIGLRLFALDAMQNMQIEVLDELDQFKRGVTDFKGCNNEIND